MKRAAIITSLLLAACTDDGPTLVQSTVQSDLFTQRDEPVLDVLWVIDDSPSMAAEQEKIVAESAAFFAGLQARRVDYHIGVVTTDPASGGVLEAHGGAAVPGCDGCRYISRAVPCADPAADCPASDVFEGLVRVGVAGSPSERGLETAAAALGLTVVDGSTGLPVIDPLSGRPVREVPPDNRGFLREEADLVLVLVSDEDEGLKEAGVPVRYYQRLFSLLKARSDQRVLLSAITGWPVEGQGFEGIVPAEAICGQLGALADLDRTNDDGALEILRGYRGKPCVDEVEPDAEYARAEPGLRYVELACAMGGQVASICARDYRASLARLTESALQLGRSFVLRQGNRVDRGADCQLFTDDDPRADCDGDGNTEGDADGPICVRAVADGSDGTPVLVPRDAAAGWRFDEAGVAVSFDGSFVPAPETDVEISYRVSVSACP